MDSAHRISPRLSGFPPESGGGPAVWRIAAVLLLLCVHATGENSTYKSDKRFYPSWILGWRVDNFDESVSDWNMYQGAGKRRQDILNFQFLDHQPVLWLTPSTWSAEELVRAVSDAMRGAEKPDGLTKFKVDKGDPIVNHGFYPPIIARGESLNYLIERFRRGKTLRIRTERDNDIHTYVYDLKNFARAMDWVLHKHGYKWDQEAQEIAHGVASAPLPAPEPPFPENTAYSK